MRSASPPKLHRDPECGGCPAQHRFATASIDCGGIRRSVALPEMSLLLVEAKLSAKLVFLRVTTPPVVTKSRRRSRAAETHAAESHVQEDIRLVDAR